MSRIRSLLLFLLLLGLTTVIAAVTENDDETIDNSQSNDSPEIDGTQQQSQDDVAKKSQKASPGGAGTKRATPKPQYKSPKLDSNSVVLITGAAGFIGSELAISLKRTYNPKKILLVDNLGIDSVNEGLFVPPPPPQLDENGNIINDGKGRYGQTAIYKKLSEEQLSLFEIKRQRAFRIFHELTSPSYAAHDDDEEGGGDSSSSSSSSSSDKVKLAESVRFYRSDMRPSLPEFFDFGEVPLLEGIFLSHPDITHVVHLADVPLSEQNSAIPRNKDSVKAGRFEGLLEEMRLIIQRAAKASSSDDGGSGTNTKQAAQLPQIVYASSHELYDRFSEPSKTFQPQNPSPFREDKPITTPSTMHGTAKLIDEVLASAYHSTHGIYSVGLRFFNVYGPWNTPGTDIFDLAESISSLNKNDGSDKNTAANDAEGVKDDEKESATKYDKDIDDYIYIDDAVDAILCAMQYRPLGDDNPPPVVFNVGSGEGHTLKEIKENMSKHFPTRLLPATGGNNLAFEQRDPTKSIASTSHSEALLGFKARVPLEQGLAQTLTWHRDRTFPYGLDLKMSALSSNVDLFSLRGIETKIEESLAISRRRATSSSDPDEDADDGDCSILDRECLRGAPVFPCASECRRSERCTPSVWDDVSILSKMVTTGCDAVLYTILLDDTAEQIPSATTTAKRSSMPYVGAGLPEDVGRRTQARCNIAFVSDKSPLVKRLKSEGEEYIDDDGTDSSGSDSRLPPLLRHGFWTVLPVPTSSADSDSSALWLHAFDGAFALEYLPKISPGRFFGSSVRYAVYIDPSVRVDNLPNLLKKMEDGPPIPSVNKNGASIPAGTRKTALMLAAKQNPCGPTQRGSSCTNTYTRPPPNDALQSHVYNMIRMALRGDLLGGGLDSTLDSSLVVHSLREGDSRLFRCDIYSEAAQWGVSSDERAFEFIVSLHDLWSRAVIHWSTGLRPWWVDVGTDIETLTDGAKLESEHTKGQRLVGDSMNEEGMWMSILSSSDAQFFTHIVPSDSEIVHLE